MSRAALWFAGLALSACLHVAAIGIFLATRSLEEAPQQQSAESQFQLDTVTAPTQEAQAQTPEGEAASEATANASAVGAGAVPQSRVSASEAPTTRTDAVRPVGAPISAVEQAADTVQPVLSEGVTIAAVVAPTEPSQSLRAEGTPLAEAENSQTALPAVTEQAMTISSLSAPSAISETLAPEGTSIAEVENAATNLESVVSQPDASVAQVAIVALAGALPAVAPNGDDSVAIAPNTEMALASALPTSQAPVAVAQIDAPQPEVLPATLAKASLAWQFGDRLITDPQALATVQAFMAPDSLANNDANAGDVKDGLTGLLTSIDCARLSATFLPESGTLEMRGHIPDPSLQGPLLDALRAQVGEGIPVTANLLHLPDPQCGALTGISNVGLPQSTDQFTNDRLVGASAHAREYTYSEGQRLEFDLAAPDYDAFVYVDYFNADGEVIHLVPNETIALEKSVAEALFGVGQDRSDLPSLRITIGPPYGQEIAVAFAASEPLYEGLRPIVEPAAPYLEWLQTRVAEARESNADFKGEWVYFFITTQPNTQ